MLKKEAVFKNKDFFFLLMICLVFLSFTITNIRYTELVVDEANPTLWGVYFLKNKDIRNFFPADIHLFGRWFPVRLATPYLFALPSYLLLPFLIVFGINVFAVKMLGIVLSVLALPMLYYICRKLFNRKVGLITILLLALSPNFIDSSRMGLRITEPIINFFFISSVFFFIKYYNEKRSFYLYLASYLLGAGLSIKLTVASRLLGLFFAIAVFFSKEALNFIKALKIKQKLSLVLFFCLGAFLFIYFNIITKGETFKLARYLYTDSYTTQWTNNFHLGANLKLRLAQLESLTAENIDQAPAGYQVMIRENVFRFLIIAFILNLAFAFFFKRNRRELKLLLSIYLLYVVMFFASCFTAGSLVHFHLVSLYPFPQLVIAVFISYLSLAISKARLTPILKKSASILVSLVIILPLVLFDIRVIIAYHSRIRKTGGESYWLSGLCDILKYVQENKLNGYPVLCSKDFVNFAYFINKGEFAFNNEFQSYSLENRDFLLERLKAVLNETNRIYFIGTILNGDIIEESLLKQDIISLNKKFTLEKTFYNKAGQPQYYLYRVE